MSARPTGIETNGIGKRTTAHLNFTRSVADVMTAEAMAALREKRASRRAKYSRIADPARADGKVKFAGLDQREAPIKKFDWRRN